MKIFQKEWNGNISSFLPLFVTSVVVVWVFLLIQGRDLLLRTEVLEESTLELMKYQVQECRSLFFYVLKERVFVIPIIFLASTTYLATAFCYGLVIWYGAGTGAVIGVAMLRYGVKGVCMVLASALPQYLLYVPAMIVALRLSLGKRQITKRFLLQGFLLEVVVIIGCALESYVNPIWVEKFIEFFIIG